MTRAARHLHTLLEEERRALLAGNLDGLDDLAQRKQHCAENLARTRPDSATLDALRSAIERNAALMQAAHDGIGDVMRALDARRLAARTTFYRADGSAAQPQQPPHKVERKA
ncbi:MAG: hypothetical protein JJU09_12690 [Rhodobacteraceae bacterium]|nr:hypothetical protein [Paracoccaceae bacterium]TVR48658.1 MAG: hypothetical protein EA386_04080 [Paracoccaceae bacterium]